MATAEPVATDGYLTPFHVWIVGRRSPWKSVGVVRAAHEALSIVERLQTMDEHADRLDQLATALRNTVARVESIATDRLFERYGKFAKAEYGQAFSIGDHSHPSRTAVGGIWLAASSIASRLGNVRGKRRTKAQSEALTELASWRVGPAELRLDEEFERWRRAMASADPVAWSRDLTSTALFGLAGIAYFLHDSPTNNIFTPAVRQPEALDDALRALLDVASCHDPESMRAVGPETSRLWEMVVGIQKEAGSWAAPPLASLDVGAVCKRVRGLALQFGESLSSLALKKEYQCAQDTIRREFEAAEKRFRCGRLQRFVDANAARSNQLHELARQLRTKADTLPAAEPDESPEFDRDCRRRTALINEYCYSALHVIRAALKDGAWSQGNDPEHDNSLRIWHEVNRAFSKEPDNRERDRMPDGTVVRLVNELGFPHDPLMPMEGMGARFLPNLMASSFADAIAFLGDALAKDVESRRKLLESLAGASHDATRSSASEAGRDLPDRDAAARDHLWLKWKRDEKMTPARIRDRWNAMPDDERRSACQLHWNRIGAGERGRDLVKKALVAAEMEVPAEEC